MILNRSLIYLLSTMTACTSYCSVAYGQDAAEHGAAQATGVSSNGSDEIVVTAQKREQAINRVGLTIQASTSESLVQRGITAPSDLAKLVPGFSATQSIYATPVYTLRGVGLYDATFGAAPAVAIYTDQIPRNFPVMSDGLDLDLERVEVLKGPQGTVFGQSATGGAINYITAKPTSGFSAGIRGSYERFGRLDVSGHLSGPLSDTLRARLAVGVTQGGAWQYSLSRPGDKNGDARMLKGRLSLDWTPSATLKLQFSATGARDRSDVQAGQYFGTTANVYSAATLTAANVNPATANPFGYVDEALYAGLTTPSSLNFDPNFLTNRAVLISRLNSGDAVLADGARAILGTPISTKIRAADWGPNAMGRSGNNYYQFTLRGDLKLSDIISLTSISAFARKDLDYLTDVDGTTASVYDNRINGHVRAFNQELRLAADTSKFHGILGVSFDSSSFYERNTSYIFDTGASQLLPNLPRALGTLNDERAKSKTYAVFGNAEYDLTPRLTVIGGVRFTQTNQSAASCNRDHPDAAGAPLAAFFSVLQNLLTGQNVPQIAPGACYVLGDGQNGTTFGHGIIDPFHLPLKENNVSFRLGANYKFDSGMLVYVTVSQGYKAGVLPLIGASSTSQYAAAKQEKVINYEAGFKAPLLDHRVQFNGALFYDSYSDKQVRARLADPIYGLLEAMVNVPKSRIWGIEGELSARPATGLTLSASGTYLNSKVTSSFTQTASGLDVYNAQGYKGDFKGSRLPFTSKLSANADIQYEWKLNSSLSTFLGSTVLYQGKQNTTFETQTLQASFFSLPRYATVDLRAGLADPNSRWRITVYGRNVFNKYYMTAITSYLETRVRYTGRPATYGVSISYDF